jgi:glycine/D-amino acid oxidase-like deaminating enzyme
MTSIDVAIVGLGIVGASAAYAAARGGARVLALDAGVAGAGTSATSFAWLNAVRKEPETYHRLNADGMAEHVALARELGAGDGHHGGGSLEWAAAGAPHDELRERVARLAARGYAASWIDREAAVDMEPALVIPDHVAQVAFYASDAWLDAPRLIRTLLGAAARLGADVRERARVEALHPRGRRVETLIVGGAPLRAGAVLICVGPSTEAFLTPLGVHLPVGRVAGLLAVTSPPATPSLQRVVHAPGVHLRPDASGGLLLGADDVDPLAAADDAPRSLDALAALLLERAAGVVPAARATKIVDRRIGLRPMPADRHTIAGRIPGFDNAWVIATHSGVTLGPLLGRLIAAEIAGAAAHATLAPFRPDRFEKSASARERC